MTPQELKKSLLRCALQGKLVEQHFEEGNAALEYRGAALCMDAIEDEVPYDIPNSWVWIRLSNVATNQNGYAFKPSDWQPSGTKIIRIQNLTDCNAPANYCNKELIDKKFYIQRGDVLVSWSCTIDSFLYNGEDAVLNQHIFKIIFDKINIDKMYYIYAIKSLLEIIDSKRHGSTMTHITKKDFEALLLPLPPLAEQKRIVAKIEELLPYIDRYEQAWSKLEDFNKRFPVDMQKSILQMAIQGKLVEQRPEEGTGEELLKLLYAEKEKIIESGALKGRKTKPLQGVSFDDIPFEIPNTWCWIRLGNVAEIFGRIGFRGYTKNDIVPSGEGAITISPSNIRPNGKTDFSDCTYLSWEKYEESPEIKVFNGDILLVKTGSSYGKCGIVCNLPEKATINPQLAILKYITCDVKYLDYVLKSPMARSQFESFVIGTSIPTFSQEKLANLLLPLPPLAEQKRIVAKLEKILPLCEKLKKS